MHTKVEQEVYGLGPDGTGVEIFDAGETSVDDGLYMEEIVDEDGDVEVDEEIESDE